MKGSFGRYPRPRAAVTPHIIQVLPTLAHPTDRSDRARERDREGPEQRALSPPRISIPHRMSSSRALDACFRRESKYWISHQSSALLNPQSTSRLLHLLFPPSFLRGPLSTQRRRRGLPNYMDKNIAGRSAEIT